MQRCDLLPGLNYRTVQDNMNMFLIPRMERDDTEGESETT